jgi:hypothetical protein
VSIPGGTVTFLCLPFNGQSISTIHWFVNGTELDQLAHLNVEQHGTGNGTLTIHNISEAYNGTLFECEECTASGRHRSFQNAHVLLQGIITVASACSQTE